MPIAKEADLERRIKKVTAQLISLKAQLRKMRGSSQSKEGRLNSAAEGMRAALEGGLKR